MDHSVVAAILQFRVQPVAIQQVTRDEPGGLMHGFPMPMQQVVDCRDGMAVFDEALGDNTTDITGGAGDEDSHREGELKPMRMDRRPTNRPSRAPTAWWRSVNLA